MSLIFPHLRRLSDVSKSNLLAGAVIGLLLAYWIGWAFQWTALVFTPWAAWELYAVLKQDEDSLLTHAMIRLLRNPFVAAVLAGACWNYFLSGQPRAVHKAAIAVGLLVHFVFQNRSTYEDIWKDAGLSAKHGFVRVQGVKSFHPGEPVFVLRGQDWLMTRALNAYADRLLEAGERTKAHEVRAVAQDVAGWQERNPQLVKLPD